MSIELKLDLLAYTAGGYKWQVVKLAAPSCIASKQPFVAAVPEKTGLTVLNKGGLCSHDTYWL